MKRTALRSRPTRHCASCAAAGRTICIHGKGPERRTRLKPINKERADKAFAKNFHSDEFVQFTRSYACLFCGGWPTMTAHILHSRGAGGDHMACGPACFACDHVWENQGREALLKMHGLTWAEVEWRVAAHQRAFADYLRASREDGDD